MALLPLVERRGIGRRAGDKLLTQLVEDLKAYQTELEAQNKILRYSQATTEAASERFETLFSGVPLPLMMVDEHDMVVQANPTAHRRFQPTEQDRALVSLMPFVDPRHTAQVERAFADARSQGRGEATEVVFAIGPRQALMGDLLIARIETPQDDMEPLLQYICAVIDQGPLLAERRALMESAAALQQRNEQLHASERRLEAVINSALDAIICVDQHQRITVFNPTASALFQCVASEALGSRLERFLPEAAQALAFAQLTTQAVLGEMTARTATGRELAVEVSVSFERHAEGETTTVFARDLTGPKKAEAHRNLLEQQLRESQKMQAVGTMAGGIAHDFNNILSAILGNAALAMADVAPGTPSHESLAEIDKAGRRARDLVRQILTFSRNEPVQRTPLQLADVLLSTGRLLRVTLPPRITLQLQIEDDLPPVLADATQLEQALLNLGTNAIHAVEGGRGTVIFEASCVVPDSDLCSRLGLRPGRYVAVAVRDNGSGIPADRLDRIFEPFFTTKPVGQGTGLGLAVVHGVMRSHEGAADVWREPGQGSIFTLYFPAEGYAGPVPPPAPAPMPPAPPAAAPQAGAGRHVMYVDDDEALVFLVQRLLRRRGYTVSGFSDPHAAADALRAAPADYDLLVTDYNMPGYSGIDLLRAAHAIRADLPVALASGYITAEIEEAARAEGASALIHKPDDVEELCATVERLTAR
nr:ATP-binding protein [Xylophilus sp.]